jgi:hypothetical protein
LRVKNYAEASVAPLAVSKNLPAMGVRPVGILILYGDATALQPAPSIPQIRVGYKHLKDLIQWQSISQVEKDAS